jgi:hypothetical protein
MGLMRGLREYGGENAYARASLELRPYVPLDLLCAFGILWCLFLFEENEERRMKGLIERKRTIVSLGQRTRAREADGECECRDLAEDPRRKGSCIWQQEREGIYGFVARHTKTYIPVILKSAKAVICASLDEGALISYSDQPVPSDHRHLVRTRVP